MLALRELCRNCVKHFSKVDTQCSVDGIMEEMGSECGTLLKQQHGVYAA